MRKQLVVATFLTGITFAVSAMPTMSVLSYIVRNGAADSVLPIAKLQNLSLANLPQCRFDVANDVYGMVTEASNFSFSLFNDPLAATARMSAVAPDIFAAAYDVLEHITSTYGSDTLTCIQRASAEQSIAGCQNLLGQLRENVATSFLKMGSVTTAIAKSIISHCELKPDSH